MSINKKLNLEMDNVVYDYKLFDTLKAIKSNNSQRKAAKELGISHTVLNRRIIKAEELLSEPLVTVSNKGSTLTSGLFIIGVGTILVAFANNVWMMMIF